MTYEVSKFGCPCMLVGANDFNKNPIEGFCFF